MTRVKQNQMTELIDLAQRFSIEKHNGQKYGNYPYSVHLLETYKIAELFNLSEEIKIACFLHDTLEDTKTKYSELKDIFGKNVAELVYAVTDELGRDRTEKKKKTYVKITKAGIPSAILKLCDRVANMQNAIYHNNPIIKKYQKEHEDFCKMYHYLGLTDRPIYKYYLFLLADA